ncbi:putative sporulation protein YtaF [Pullulanibacillus pueri]|uniref:Sporulation membrane protein YtaF n=1 Tax=Pullulanibacillus pueri TaxID=1437324 RepID=A0A8J3EMR8_9BACL|nr:manganese efflux pump [Pullulanibacillus pueri]MBM7680635.1 putative sporulation protein YtaF [Pullulanibacillus pueri]GGH83875.1 sporulation membrane protein YtaF [Pullulanibacillus pueri]
MHLFSAIFIGVVANIDNLIIGCSYGMKKTKIPWLSNIIIAAISMLFSLISLFAGHWISTYIQPHITNTIGGLLLLIIGALTVWSSFYERSKKSNQTQSPFLKVIYEPKDADLDQNHSISMKESLLLGTALAINSISTSFSVGLTSASIVSFVASIGLFSVLFISIGGVMGKSIQKRIKNMELYAPILSGVLLILIGLYEIIY